jgi:hypothetical protein
MREIDRNLPVRPNSQSLPPAANRDVPRPRMPEILSRPIATRMREINRNPPVRPKSKSPPPRPVFQQPLSTGRREAAVPGGILPDYITEVHVFPSSRFFFSFIGPVSVFSLHILFFHC